MSRKGENIYKRKDGRWEGRYKKILSNDTTQYFSVYGKTYNEVKQKLLKAKTSVNYSKSNIYMFNDIALEWLNNTKPNIKHSTFVKYTNIVNNHLLPYFVKSRIENITTSIVKDYVAMKLQNGNIQTNKPLSPKTVKDIVSVLKMILEYGDSEQQKSICNFKQRVCGKSCVSNI